MTGGSSGGERHIGFIAVLVLATAIGPFAMQVFLPALPAIQTGFGVNAATAQLVFSLSAFAIAISMLVYGPVSDRLGRRPALLGGLAVYLAGSVLCVATVYCTSMIYGSLKSIQAWHTPLTPLCYLLFSAAGGALLLAFAAWGGGLDVAPFVAAASLLILAAWAAKWVWWGRLRSMAPLSTAETATGLGAIGKVRLFERPHMTENYLTNEMGYRIARKHARKLSGIATFWGGLAAVAVLVLPYLVWPTAGLLPLLPALLLFGAGVAVERWLFFAEARHAVMNYYGG